MTHFAAEVFHNPYLPIGGTTVEAIVTVTATDVGRTGNGQSGAAEVLIVDTSGSMGYPRSKLDQAKRATQTAIDNIRNGVLFGIVAGNSGGEVVFPRSGFLVAATDATRRAAKTAVQRLRPEGGTAMGQWLLAANWLFQGTAPGSIRHALLLTDGRNETESHDDLAAAIAACEGSFQCDCRGVGADWEVEELRMIASALLGTVDVIPRPEQMAAAFAAIMDRTMALDTAEVAIRVSVPDGAAVRLLKQVSPEIEDLTARWSMVDARTVEFPTGAWGPETRDYHLRVEVPPHHVGVELLAARFNLMVGGEVIAKAFLPVTWTEDRALSTTICREVAQFTGQVELADAIEGGLDARKQGHDDEATAMLGRAVALAHQLGHHEQLARLSAIVEIDDPATGTVRLRSEVAEIDELVARTRSTRTIRVGGSPP